MVNLLPAGVAALLEDKNYLCIPRVLNVLTKEEKQTQQMPEPVLPVALFFLNG